LLIREASLLLVLLLVSCRCRHGCYPLLLQPRLALLHVQA